MSCELQLCALVLMIEVLYIVAISKNHSPFIKQSSHAVLKYSVCHSYYIVGFG